ncbi:unnamed protein product [Miscanthus lutarioriparius]|uniref:Uncharacterized protein n=1 Tax=Miscanthus lutarioriparius TaxID=422564 RepID=A0A811RSX7_9POAL|nr:unnamed protein product [Miscanthus lutarioriparius]
MADNVYVNKGVSLPNYDSSYLGIVIEGSLVRQGHTRNQAVPLSPLVSNSNPQVSAHERADSRGRRWKGDVMVTSCSSSLTCEPVIAIMVTSCSSSLTCEPVIAIMVTSC